MTHMKKPMAALSVLSAAVLMALAPASASAAGSDADARIKELEKKLEKSIQMIESLQSEVQSLKESKASAAAPAAAPANAEQAAKIEVLEQQVAQLGSGLASRTLADDGLAIHGFTDVGLRRSGENNPVYGRGNKGFNLGNFDLYLTPQLGTNVRSLVELNFEVDNSGAIGTDLERLQIGYAFSDALTTWVGRFHTPYGYWNTAFHHGAQLQTSVLRPRFLDFEDKGGILPAHATGAWATGTFGMDSGKAGYDLYVANAQRIDSSGVLDMRMAGDAKFRASGGFNAWFSPRSLSALRVGLHGLRGNIADDNTNTLTRLSMVGGYGTFIDDNWEALAEYYRFNNTDLSGGTGSHQSTAWYAQLGYNLGQFTPYGRLEKADLNQADNYFALQANGRSYDRSVIGLRYDVNPKAALKFELNRTNKKDLGTGIADNRYNEAYIQYSIRF